MKFAILMLCVIGFVFAEEKYDSSNDNIDLSELLGNDRLIEAYTKCLINNGPCTPDVKKLKEKLPEVLETKCVKCTDKQKQVGKQLVKEIRDKHPTLWKELVAFYDPQGKYKESFEEFIKS